MPHCSSYAYSTSTVKDSISNGYAYWSLVRLYLEYCCPVVDPYTIRNINHLEGVQQQAARFVVHNYSWETSGSTLASALSWPTLEHRRAEARLTTVYKITNNLLDINPNQHLMLGHSQTRSNHLHKYRQISTSHRIGGTIGGCRGLKLVVYNI